MSSKGKNGEKRSKGSSTKAAVKETAAQVGDKAEQVQRRPSTVTRGTGATPSSSTPTAEQMRRAAAETGEVWSEMTDEARRQAGDAAARASMFRPRPRACKSNMTKRSMAPKSLPRTLAARPRSGRTWPAGISGRLTIATKPASSTATRATRRLFFRA